MADRRDLDSVVHGPLRLAVLTILSSVDQAGFSHLKQLTDATDGNLSIHLHKLERAGYVKSRKRFVERKPQTSYRLTSAGREALLAYIRDLKQLLALNPDLVSQLTAD